MLRLSGDLSEGCLSEELGMVFSAEWDVDDEDLHGERRVKGDPHVDKWYQVVQNTEDTICKNHVVGRCNREFCSYRHFEELHNLRCADGSRVCVADLFGETCRRGRKCPYYHPSSQTLPPSPRRDRVYRSRLATSTPYKSTSFTRAASSCTVSHGSPPTVSPCIASPCTASPCDGALTWRSELDEKVHSHRRTPCPHGPIGPKAPKVQVRRSAEYALLRQLDDLMDPVPTKSVATQTDPMEYELFSGPSLFA